MGLQRDFADAVAQVSQLNELTLELEGRLEHDHTVHEEAVAGRDEEIDLLNQRVWGNLLSIYEQLVFILWIDFRYS